MQAIEARRWALTYGSGFEAQTGNAAEQLRRASTSAASRAIPRARPESVPACSADITRNNLFGRELVGIAARQLRPARTEDRPALPDPAFEAIATSALNFTGGYANSQDVTTYVASKLEGGLRFTEHFTAPNPCSPRPTPLIYEFNFRRVKVQANSLQVSPGEIALLSTAVRVAGPAFTWMRDTRDSPLDAHRGTYTSFQEFLSDKVFGAQAEFNRLDISNSSYYSFDKGRLVLARNTRYGQERAFGNAGEELIPLPERLYAGGATSLRGFSINAAGPRDPETGYPIGGAGALINSTELRLPPPTLPWFGDTLSFVLFHDMGNVFANASRCLGQRPAHPPAGPRCLQDTIARRSCRSRPPPPGPNTSTGLAGPVQLQLLFARAGHWLALPYARRAHPPGFQL